MATKYLPIALGLIEEGELSKDVDREIRTAVDALYAHVQRCARLNRSGKGAKACVTLKLTFQRLEDAYDLKGEVSSKLPGRPAHVTTAFEGSDEAGKQTLMVPASGSTEDDPRQGRLATRDGSAVVDGEKQAPVAPEPGGKRRAG